MRKITQRHWWKRWYSGAYDRLPVIRRKFLIALEELAWSDPGYFLEDLQELKKTGRISRPTKSTRDCLVGTCHDLGIVGHEAVYKIECEILVYCGTPILQSVLGTFEQPHD